MQENFSNAPESIGEIKANKHYDASLWTVREMLISILREIDSGNITPKCASFFYLDENKSGLRTHWFLSGGSVHEVVGVSEIALHDIKSLKEDHQ